MKAFKILKRLTLVVLLLCFTLGGCAQGSLSNGEAEELINGLTQEVTGIDMADKKNEDNLLLNSQESAEYVYVSLILNNGSLEKIYQVKRGEAFAQPTTPTFGEHIFLGWFSDGKEYDFSAPVTKNITIQALWEKVYSSDLYIAMGAPTVKENGFVSGNGANILANTTQGFDRGSIEVTVSSSTPSDSGIIFCLENNGSSTFWESNVSYYFFFVNIEGSAYLGKVDNGKWSALKVLPIDGFVQGESYTIKVILNGTDIYCYVNGELYIGYSEIRFLTGGGFGLRTGAAGVSFTNFKVSGKCE